MSVKSMTLNFGDPSVSIEAANIEGILELSVLDNDNDGGQSIYLDRADLFELIEVLEKFCVAMRPA